MVVGVHIAEDVRDMGSSLDKTISHVARLKETRSSESPRRSRDLQGTLSAATSVSKAANGMQVLSFMILRRLRKRNPTLAGERMNKR
jgi:uncharacterized protein with von Willebrand factor type A (vWA) domain